MTTSLPARLCDVCRSPGACCKNFQLNISFWDDKDIHEQWQHKLLEFGAVVTGNGVHGNDGVHGEMSQFVPAKSSEQHWLDEESGRTYSRWGFMCKALQPNGLCGMYDKRPRVCRDYKEGSDKLCVMYVEKTYPTGLNEKLDDRTSYK